MISLHVKDSLHRGWSSARVSLGIDRKSGAFTLVVSDHWYEGGKRIDLPLSPGDACRLSLDGTIVIDGFIDTLSPSYESASHSITVQGRDRSADLVDCSASLGEFNGRRLGDIVQSLCAPFSVQVTIQDDGESLIDHFAVTPGETVSASLERLCRQRAVFLWPDGEGGLILGRLYEQEPVDILQRGKNILSASSKISWEQRFSHILLKGQREGGRLGTSEVWGDDSEATTDFIHPHTEVRDPEISRYRPLLLLPETQDRATSLRQRAEMEMRVRRGRSRSATVRVQGWRHAGGKLWKPGQTVLLRDDWLRMDERLLIAAIDYQLGENSGTTAELSLVPASSFDRLQASS